MSEKKAPDFGPVLMVMAEAAGVEAGKQIVALAHRLEKGNAPVSMWEALTRIKCEAEVALMYLDNWRNHRG